MFQDCLAGITMTLLSLPLMLSYVEAVDHFQVTHPLSPLVCVLPQILACVYYPKPKIWSITRGDTSNIVSMGTLVGMGTWLNYQLGWMHETPVPSELQPLPSVTMEWFLYSLVRTIGGVVALATFRIVFKKIALKFLCNCAGLEVEDIPKQRELGLEVPLRWLVVGGMAFNTAFTLPIVFQQLGIGRENYYSEVGL